MAPNQPQDPSNHKTSGSPKTDKPKKPEKPIYDTPREHSLHMANYEAKLELMRGRFTRLVDELLQYVGRVNLTSEVEIYQPWSFLRVASLVNRKVKIQPHLEKGIIYTIGELQMVLYYHATTDLPMVGIRRASRGGAFEAFRPAEFIGSIYVSHDRISAPSEAVKAYLVIDAQLVMQLPLFSSLYEETVPLYETLVENVGIPVSLMGMPQVAFLKTEYDAAHPKRAHAS